jgi:hypothetical protein
MRAAACEQGGLASSSSALAKPCKRSRIIHSELGARLRTGSICELEVGIPCSNQDIRMGASSVACFNAHVVSRGRSGVIESKLNRSVTPGLVTLTSARASGQDGTPGS